MKRKHHYGLILFLILLVIFLCVLVINYRQFASKQLNPVQTTSIKRAASFEDKETIVGAYRDDRDGAAIVFNENGTGRYVYADNQNSDTNDALTWRKDGNHYLITLKDRDVTNPLTATLNESKLVVSGSDGWNTEMFKKTTQSLDLQEFLTAMHAK